MKVTSLSLSRLLWNEPSPQSGGGGRRRHRWACIVRVRLHLLLVAVDVSPHQLFGLQHVISDALHVQLLAASVGFIPSTERIARRWRRRRRRGRRLPAAVAGLESPAPPPARECRRGQSMHSRGSLYFHSSTQLAVQRTGPAGPPSPSSQQRRSSTRRRRRDVGGRPPMIDQPPAHRGQPSAVAAAAATRRRWQSCPATCQRVHRRWRRPLQQRQRPARRRAARPPAAAPAATPAAARRLSQLSRGVRAA